jgi:hypothetical protein
MLLGYAFPSGNVIHYFVIKQLFYEHEVYSFIYTIIMPHIS